MIGLALALKWGQILVEHAKLERLGRSTSNDGPPYVALDNCRVRYPIMPNPFPHEGVWTRLGVSKISGIGVFAIRAIPAGTDVFANDRADFRWIEQSQLVEAKLTAEQRQLYEDFAVGREGRLGCPQNFNLLTVGWYLNQPEEGDLPNVQADSTCRMVTSRDIAAGEELTVKYETFSER